MAIVAIPSGDRMQLRVQVGTDPETLKPVYRTRTWSNIKPGTSDENLYNFGDKLGELCADDLDSITRVKIVTLMDDGS